MIQGSFAGPPGRRRPQIVAHVAIDLTGKEEEVTFIVDTGADRSLLSVAAAEALGLDAQVLPAGRSLGIGGAAATALAPAVLRLGTRRFRVTVRVLVAGTDVQRRLPSVLGGDMLAHFGLYIEERRDLVVLLEPEEADALALP